VNISVDSDSTSDRYFMALYRKLLDPALQSSNKITLFLNLLFKSLKNDEMEKRVQVILSFSHAVVVVAEMKCVNDGSDAHHRRVAVVIHYVILCSMVTLAEVTSSVSQIGLPASFVCSSLVM